MFKRRHRRLGGGWHGQGAFWRWVGIAVGLGLLLGLALAQYEGNL